jgi:hypothetical protein
VLLVRQTQYGLACSLLCATWQTLERRRCKREFTARSTGSLRSPQHHRQTTPPQPTSKSAVCVCVVTAKDHHTSQHHRTWADGHTINAMSPSPSQRSSTPAAMTVADGQAADPPTEMQDPEKKASGATATIKHRLRRREAELTAELRDNEPRRRIRARAFCPSDLSTGTPPAMPRHRSSWTIMQIDRH